jgi:hypothetical protein
LDGHGARRRGVLRAVLGPENGLRRGEGKDAVYGAAPHVGDAPQDTVGVGTLAVGVNNPLHHLPHGVVREADGEEGEHDPSERLRPDAVYSAARVRGLSAGSEGLTQHQKADHRVDHAFRDVPEPGQPLYPRGRLPCRAFGMVSNLLGPRLISQIPTPFSFEHRRYLTRPPQAPPDTLHRSARKCQARYI